MDIKNDIYVDSAGNEILIKDMDKHHLINAFRMAIRLGVNYTKSRDIEEKLEKEIIKRLK